MKVSYEISEGKITGHYEDGTEADFGDAAAPFKAVMGRAPDGQLMVCIMPDEHWAAICESMKEKQDEKKV